MPGLILILASEPWGPVRVETAADLGGVMARGFQPAWSADVGDRDLEQVAAAVRSRLPPGNGLGMIAAGLDIATQAVASAFSAVPAAIVPTSLGNGANGLACEPVAAIEIQDGANFRGQSALARESVSPVKPKQPRPAGPEIDVREIRGKLKLTQDAFAKAFGFAVATVRDWEQGRKTPEAAARHLLMVIEHRPNVVRDALGRYGVASV